MVRAANVVAFAAPQQHPMVDITPTDSPVELGCAMRLRRGRQ
jgi:hypothetical protein